MQAAKQSGGYWRCSFFGFLACMVSLVIAEAAQAAPIAPPPYSILHAGRLLAEPGKEPVSQATIIVEKGTIKEVRSGYADAAALGLPPGTPTIDLTGMFVMPGFIDPHVHLSSGGERERDLALRESDNYFTVIAYRSAMATLMGGFTTVRDLGSTGYTVLGLRDAVRDGIVLGPRILASGDPISPTNGHADNHNLREELLEGVLIKPFARPASKPTVNPPALLASSLVLRQISGSRMLSRKSWPCHVSPLMP